MIRKARESELKEIKKFIDSFDELDLVWETFSQEYYERIMKKGILLVADI